MAMRPMSSRWSVEVCKTAPAAERRRGVALGEVPPESQGDREGDKGLRRSGSALRDAHDYWANAHLHEAVRERATNMEPAPEDMTDRREALKKDLHVFFEAVRERGMNMEPAREDMRDRKVALLAVRQDASAMTFVREAFRKDRRFCLEAVRQNASALFHCAFRRDQGVVLEAVRRRPCHETLRLAAVSLWRAPELQPERVRCNRIAGQGAEAPAFQAAEPKKGSGQRWLVVVADTSSHSETPLFFGSDATIGDLARATAKKFGLGDSVVHLFLSEKGWEHLVLPPDRHASPLDDAKPLVAPGSAATASST